MNKHERADVTLSAPRHQGWQTCFTRRHIRTRTVCARSHSVTVGQGRARLTRQWKIPCEVCVSLCVCVCVCVCVSDCVWCETQCLACSPADFSRSPGSSSHSHREREQSCEHTPTQIHMHDTHALMRM